MNNDFREKNMSFDNSVNAFLMLDYLKNLTSYKPL